MEPIKFTLCEECEHYPEVEITGEVSAWARTRTPFGCRRLNGTS